MFFSKLLRQEERSPLPQILLVVWQEERSPLPQILFVVRQEERSPLPQEERSPLPQILLLGLISESKVSVPLDLCLNLRQEERSPLPQEERSPLPQYLSKNGIRDRVHRHWRNGVDLCLRSPYLSIYK